MVELALNDEVAALLQLLADELVRVLYNQKVTCISTDARAKSSPARAGEQTDLNIETLEVSNLIGVVALLVQRHGWHLVTLYDLRFDGNAVIVVTKGRGLVNNTSAAVVLDVGVVEHSEGLGFVLRERERGEKQQGCQDLCSYMKTSAAADTAKADAGPGWV